MTIASFPTLGTGKGMSNVTLFTAPVSANSFVGKNLDPFCNLACNVMKVYPAKFLKM